MVKKTVNTITTSYKNWILEELAGGTETKRKQLNYRAHILDLSRSSLEQEGKISDKLYTYIIESIKYGIPVYTSLDNVPPDRALYFIDIPGFLVGLVASGEGDNYKALRTHLNYTIKSIPRTRFEKFDLGHIPQAHLEELTSPAEAKLLDIVSKVSNPRVLELFNKNIEELQSIQGSVTTSFHNMLPEQLTNLKKAIGRGVIGSTFVIVTLQSSKHNQDIGRQLEAGVFRKIRKAILEDFVEVEGSNTLKEDIAQAIFTSLKDGKSSLSKHSPHKSTSPINIKPKANSKISTTRLRNKQGRFLSLASLQALLNQALHEQIRQNMGTGSDKKILNYRTGRFASSARVEKITQSREGMLTAFYTYMKYPYATFSEGGKQQYPRSRDPKLLISKSIKDIATTIVENRLRSVCV